MRFGTCVTRENAGRAVRVLFDAFTHHDIALQRRRRRQRPRTLNDIRTLRIPLLQTALLSFTSMRTSDVFIVFCANFLICRDANTARSVVARLSRHTQRLSPIDGRENRAHGFKQSPSPSRASHRAASPVAAPAPTPLSRSRLGSHRIASHRHTHRRDRARRALLERDPRDGLAEVDRVLASHDIGGFCFASHGSCGLCVGKRRRATASMARKKEKGWRSIDRWIFSRDR